MKYPKIPIFVLAAAFMATPSMGLAWDWGDDDDEEVPFDEAFLFFELNDTDGDLGIHGKVDGDAWKRVKIETPNERTMMRVTARGGTGRQGLTELFFESAEPTFDELDPEVFFNRFPEGVYEWEGLTLDYEEMEGEIYLSHIIPAAPVVYSIEGVTGNPGFETEGEDEGDKICWSDIDTDDGVLIVWHPVTESHFDKWSNGATPLPGEEKIPLGDPGDVDVVYYEFVAEIDGTEFKSTALIPPGVTEWTIPGEFIDLVEDFNLVDEEGDPIEEIKFEIIVRVETGEHEDDDDETVESAFGNQSAVEDCFEI